MKTFHPELILAQLRLVIQSQQVGQEQFFIQEYQDAEKIPGTLPPEPSSCYLRIQPLKKISTTYDSTGSMLDATYSLTTSSQTTSQGVSNSYPLLLRQISAIPLPEGKT